MSVLIQRVDQMMTEGLLEEAKQMFQQPHAQAAQGIGYKEFFPYFFPVNNH